MRCFPPAVLRALLAAATTLTLIGSSGAALPDRIIVERLGRARGFPSQTLTAILRDHMGFLWVGSREGLALYDGYDVRVFEHDVSDPGSLADNAVRRLYEDTSGRLWVGLDSGGLQRLDRATGRFVTFSHDPKNPRSISHDQVFSMAEDGLGSLWVGTLEGLNRMDLATGAFERFAADPKNPGALPNPWIQDLFRDRKGRIWIATVGGGVARIDPATRRITRIPFGPDSGATDRSTLAFTIAEASDGTVHVGVEDGVFRFDETTSTLERLPIPQLHPGPRTAIVTSIAFAPDGTLWITTWDGGLVAWDPMASISRSYRHDPARETSIATDRLDQLTIDHTGEVWIASWGGGIQRFSSDSGLFATILEKRGDGGGLPEGEVTSVLEGSDGTLWIGTWGKGLCRRGAGDVVTDVAALHFPGEESEAEAETVLALAEEPGGDLWMGTMSALFRIGIGGRLEHVYRHSGNDPEGLGRGYVNALWLDRSDRLWVGTGGGGLHRLDPGKETFVHFLHDPANPGSLSDDFITSIREDSRGTIWVGTRAGGLNALDPATGEVHRFVPDPQDPHSLGHHTVTSILEDHRGIVWAGTAGGGLARIDRTGAASWSVSRVGVEDGLVSGNVVSIQEDDDGSLWIGTRRGLSRYDPEKRRFHNYVTGDGLPSLEFRPNASARGRTHLHFGTLGGVLSITRGTPFQEPAPTPTIISSVGTLEGTWKGARTPWETRELHVDYGIALSFQLDVMDLRPPHRYAYRLEGESDRWVDLGSRREITIAGLSPGAYELSVKGLDARGAWSTSERPLQIRVLPPFWMTWWFRAAAALTIGGLAWGGISARLRGLERRNRELEALHTEREAALGEARASQEALHEAYGRLRDLTRRLEDAKEEERRRIARELHDEMGQALSAVKINLKALARSSSGSKDAERVTDALSLVDGIIGHVRALSLDLRPPLLDELGLVPALRGYAEGQAMRTGVEILVQANGNAEGLRAETAITAFRIAQESIHNALRHARASCITVSVRSDQDRLTIAVRDDGSGFDPAETFQRAAAGRHLGLLGMRERVEALGGVFTVESAPESGTTVQASIPLVHAEVTT